MATYPKIWEYFGYWDRAYYSAMAQQDGEVEPAVSPYACAARPNYYLAATNRGFKIDLYNFCE